MKTRLTALAIAALTGAFASAEAEARCENGHMTDATEEAGIACIQTRSGKTIRLFGTTGTGPNIQLLGKETLQTCEAGKIMRITPQGRNCISGAAHSGDAVSERRIIRVGNLPETNGIRIFAGGRLRTE